MDLASIELVSWDVDGTLYSIERLKRRLFFLLLRAIAGGRGRAAWAELARLQRYRASIEAARTSSGNRDPIPDKDERAALLRLERDWYGRALRRAGPRRGTIELLEFFAGRKMTQVVFSDYRADYKLDALGLESRFTSIYAGECLGYLKPHPAGFERIAADFGISPGGLLHIGDRAATDAAGARAAGCQSLIIGRDFRNFATLLRAFQSP